MTINTNIYPGSEIYTSLDAFAAYIADYRNRLASARLARLYRAHWLQALQVINEEISTLTPADDMTLHAELLSVKAEFEHLLGGVTAVEQHLDKAVTPPSEVDASQPAAVFSDNAQMMTSLVAPSAPVEELPQLVMSAAPDDGHASPPSEVEVDAKTLEYLNSCLAALDAGIDSFQSRQSAYRPESDAAFSEVARLKALVCQLNAVHADACAHGAGVSIRPRSRSLMNRLEYERAVLSDTGDSTPFDADVLSDLSPTITAEQWRDLAEWYTKLSDGYAVLGEINAKYNDAERADLGKVYNALGASQACLKVLLDEVEGREQLVNRMYRRVRQEWGERGFLTGLNSTTPWDELVEQSSDLELALAEAERYIASRRAEDAKRDRQASTTEALCSLFKAEPNLGGTPALLNTHRQRLFERLDACIAAGVSPTNKTVRNLLMANGIVLLSGETRFKKHLEAVKTELARKGSQAPVEDSSKPAQGELEEVTKSEEEVEQPTDAETATMAAELTAVCQKRRILILGGVANARIVTELKEMLEGAEIQWLGTNKSSKPSKYESEIKRSWVVLFAKNMSSHAVGTMGKEWVKGAGGKFAFITAGYSSKQLIRLLHTTLRPEPII